MIIASAAVLLAGFVLLKRHTAALPGLILATFFLVFGLTGASMWNWSRDVNGAGLPAEIVAGEGIGSAGANIFATTALGAALGSFVVAGLRERVSFARLRDSLAGGSIAALAQVVSGISLMLWMAGQGPSFLRRDVYLQTDGSAVLLTAASLLGPLIGIAAFVIAAFGKSRPTRLAGLVLAIAWWALTVSVGTRLAVGFTLAALLVVGIRLALRPTLARVSFSLVGTAVLAYVSLATFAVTLIARGSPHGLLRIGSLFRNAAVPAPFVLESWITPLKWFVSSVSSAFPLTEQSALNAPPSWVLIANVNPLPSSLLNIDAFSHERLWPYFWVPLGFIGEVFGAFGPVGLATLFALVTASAGLGAALLQRRNLDVGVLLVLTITVAAGFLSIQYPSRSAGRVISFVMFGPILALILLWISRFFRLPTSERSRRGGIRRTQRSVH